MSVPPVRRPGRRILLAAALLAPLALALGPGSGEARNDARSDRLQPLRVARPGLHYVLERDGQMAGFFSEISGLGSEHAVVEHREGGEPEIVRKIPGRLKYQDIVLKRGLSADLSLWEWREQVADDFPSARSDLSVILMNRRGDTLARWNIVNGWPSKITAPTASGDDDEIAIEELTVVHEGLRRVQ